MRNCLIILFGAVIPWIIYLIINDIIELANFIVTAGAFCAAIYAIYYQHQESKQAEKNFKKQFDLQKEAALKQEIIGAWQVLANKASGNSGKKEAIEFLASQGLPLCGIDMSERTHGGRVYLDGLFKDFEGDRSKINLTGANFSGAILTRANFSYAYLDGANFSGAYVYITCGEKISLDLSVYTDSSFEFEIDERTDENGKPIYPKNNPDYRYIKLKIKYSRYHHPPAFREG